MFKICGYRQVSGEFTPTDRQNASPIQYDSYKFAFLTDEDKRYTGYATAKDGMKEITIPVKRLKEISGFDDPKDLINKSFDLLYTISYGKPVLKQMLLLK